MTAGAAARFSGRFRALMQSPWRPIRLAAWTAIPLLASPIGLIPTPLSFLPEPVAMVSFGTFFGFGWLLFRHVDQLPAVGGGPGRTLHWRSCSCRFPGWC